MRGVNRLATLLPLLMCLFAGCRENEGTDEADSPGKVAVGQTEITVAAAASLKDAFDAIGREFEKEHPEYSVSFNYGASNVLARQTEQGAPFDVIALAAEAIMDGLDSAGLLRHGTRAIFAGNRLCAVVPSDSKHRPERLSDLTGRGIERIAMASPGVPARIYAEEALQRAGLWEALESRFVYGANVRQVLDYVETGEADCGFVYTSDAALSDVAVALTIDSTLHRPIRYPVAIPSGRSVSPGADRFVSFLLGPAGKALLRKHGFDA